MRAGYKFRLAAEAEDAALRSVLRRTEMPGNVSLAFGREPSYFIGGKAGNLRHQTLVCQDRESGKIAGLGGRGVRRSYIDGAQKSVGYLDSLRLLPEARGGMTLARGYKFLWGLHGDGEVPYYVTTILEENDHARNMLEGGRAGMPVYVPFGTFVTYLIPIRKKVPARSQGGVQRCGDEDLPQAHACLNEWNLRYQLAPAYTLDDVAGRGDMLPGFSRGDLYVSKKGGAVLGTLGVWNQQSFKQTTVTGYSTGMRVLRPFYNGIARLRGLPTLPNVGQEIKLVHVALISSSDDNPEVFESLVEKARGDWSGRGHDFMVVGFSCENPLAAVVRRLAMRELRSRIYLVHSPEEKVVLPQSGRVAHLEVSTL